MTAATGTRRITPRGVGASPRPSRALLAAAAVVAAWSALPILFVVAAWATSAGSLGALLLRPRVGELLLGTAGLLLIATPACIVQPQAFRASVPVILTNGNGAARPGESLGRRPAG